MFNNASKFINLFNMSNFIKPKVMISWLSATEWRGKMAQEVLYALEQNPQFWVFPYWLASERSNRGSVPVAWWNIELLSRDKLINVLSENRPRVVVDFSHPSSVNDNAEFFADNWLNFVMWTTWWDRVLLEQTVKNSEISAVISPNMSKPIVTLLAMMRFAAKSFPEAFKWYTLEIVESHQFWKADTSWTAKAMVAHFNGLWVPFREDQIRMIRDLDDQRKFWVTEKALWGHWYHTYTLRSEAWDVMLQLIHNVDWRKTYADWSMTAIKFLLQKIQEWSRWQVFSMEDVIRKKAA